jgi:hypothetical protein
LERSSLKTLQAGSRLMLNNANVMPQHKSAGWRVISLNRPVHRKADSAKMAATVTEMSLARKAKMDSLWR